MSQYFTRPSEKFPPAVKNLILINVLVWVAQILFRRNNLTELLALWPVNSPEFKPYQVITHMFTHAAEGPQMYFHILFNMFTLWMFGRVLENVWGSKRFLIFYMICGLGAAALHMTMEYLTGGTDIAVGASGAVFGVLVAFAMLFPNTALYMMFIPIPIKAKWAILGLIALDLLGGIFQPSGDNIAHYAHLGGAVTGFILIKIWNKTNRKTLY